MLTQQSDPEGSEELKEGLIGFISPGDGRMRTKQVQERGALKYTSARQATRITQHAPRPDRLIADRSKH